MAATAKSRIAWQDKFKTPEIDELRVELPKPRRDQFDEARQRILTFANITEELVWEGHPWRWCLKHTVPNDPTRAFSYLVPNPEKPKIGVCFNADMLQSMPLHRLKK